MEPPWCCGAQLGARSEAAQKSLAEVFSEPTLPDRLVAISVSFDDFPRRRCRTGNLAADAKPAGQATQTE